MGMWLILMRLMKLLLGVSLVTVGWNAHRQSTQGKSWDMEWLRPLYMNWLAPYGITHAEIYLEKSPYKGLHGWVIGARNVRWSGGSLRDIKTHWKWHHGLSLHAVQADNLSVEQWPLFPNNTPSKPPLLPSCDINIQNISLPKHGVWGKILPFIGPAPNNFHLTWTNNQLNIHQGETTKTPLISATITTSSPYTYAFSGTLDTEVSPLVTTPLPAPSTNKSSPSPSTKPICRLTSHFKGWIQPPGPWNQKQSWSWKAQWTGHQKGKALWTVRIPQNKKHPSTLLYSCDKGTWNIETSHDHPLKLLWAVTVMDQKLNGEANLYSCHNTGHQKWNILLKHPKGTMGFYPWLGLWPSTTPAQATRSWLLSHFKKDSWVKSFDVNVRGHIEHRKPERPSVSSQQWEQGRRDQQISANPLPKNHKKYNKMSVHVDALDGHLVLPSAHLDAWHKLPLLKNLSLNATFDLKGVKIVVDKGDMQSHSIKGIMSIRWDTKPVILKLDTHLKGPFRTLLPVALALGKNPSTLKFLDVKGNVSTHISGTIPLDHSDAHSDLAITSHGSSLAALCQTGGLNLFLTGQHISGHWQKNILNLHGHGLVNRAPIQWTWRKDHLTFSSRLAHRQVMNLLPDWPQWAAFSHHADLTGTVGNDGAVTINADFTPSGLTLPGLQEEKSPGVPWSIVYHHTKTSGHIKTEGNWAAIKGHWTNEPTSQQATARLSVNGTWMEYRYMNLRHAPNQKKTSQQTSLWSHMKQQGHHQLFIQTDQSLDMRNFFKETNKKESLKDANSSTHSDQSPHNKCSSISSAPHHPNILLDIHIRAKKVFMKQGAFTDVVIGLNGTAPSLTVPPQVPWWSWYQWHEGTINATQDSPPQINKKARRFFRSQSANKQGQILGVLTKNAAGQTDMMIQILNLGAVCRGLGVSQRIQGGDLMGTLQQNYDGGFYHANISTKNIRLRSSILGKFFAMLSPTLLTDVFSSSIRFYNIDANFIANKDKIEIKNITAQGLNLGFYVKGSFSLRPQPTCALHGVAIPAYFVNTLFRRWPIVGRLFGGKKGLVSSDFTIHGPLSKPIYKIKPYSLLKLGILKKIFKKNKIKQT